jgi:hypothetical protein
MRQWNVDVGSMANYAGLEKGNLLLFWWIWRLGMSKKGFSKRIESKYNEIDTWGKYKESGF